MTLRGKAAAGWTVGAVTGQKPGAGLVDGWVIHDLVIPRQGARHVGVARQALGQGRKQVNCQIAVALSIVGRSPGVPVSCRLYLPREWAADSERRKVGRIPSHVSHFAKWEIAIDLLDAARGAGRPIAPLVADASYGHCAAFRTALSSRGVPYALEIPASALVRTAALGPMAAEQQAAEHAAERSAVLDGRDFYQDAAGTRILACRVRPAFAGDGAATYRAEEWLLAEWPCCERTPSRFWLSTLDAGSSPFELARAARLADSAGQLGRELVEHGLAVDCAGSDWAGFHSHWARVLGAYNGPGERQPV